MRARLSTHGFLLLIAESMKENVLCCVHGTLPRRLLTAAQPLTPFTFVKNSAPLSGPGALSSLPRSLARARAPPHCIEK